VLQAGRTRVRVPMKSLKCFNLPNPSMHIAALGLTQPLTETSTRTIALGGRGESKTRSAPRADITANCEPNV
jgi:hypothetical protein